MVEGDGQMVGLSEYLRWVDGLEDVGVRVVVSASN
jgi:hypothetical protein